MAGDTKDPGDIEVADPFAGMVDRLHTIAENLGRISEAVSGDGQELIRLDGGSAIPQSQHVKFRVIVIVFSRATAGDSTLSIGESTYTFTLGAVPAIVPFPLVIERGLNMSLTGDGRAYLIGNPE